MKTNIDTILPLFSPAELKKYSTLFTEQIESGLQGKRSSLPLIINPIAPQVPSDGWGIAVAVGGTNAYISSFEITDQGNIQFSARTPFLVPTHLTKKTFFELLARHVVPRLKRGKGTKYVGLGFAYPLKPFLWENRIDGKLLYTTKERNFNDLVGTDVGKEFAHFLKTEHSIDCLVGVANDAVCLLLGGDGAQIAGVVGTGLNFSYWEKTESVDPIRLEKDSPGYTGGYVAVNLESANFDKIPQSALGREVDKQSDNMGQALAEKEVSGAYLYELFNTARVRIDKNWPVLTSTDQLNDIVIGSFKFKEELSASSKKEARVLAERIFHRSAQIVAIQLCGILCKIGITSGTVPIVMEGGIFWKAYNYPSLVNSYVNAILPKVIPSFARLFGSSRRGIAILALSRSS